MNNQTTYNITTGGNQEDSVQSIQNRSREIKQLAKQNFNMESAGLGRVTGSFFFDEGEKS